MALALPEATGVWVLPLVCAAGVGGGMAWGAVPALLRTRLGVNEILTTLMLTYVASLLLGTLLFGPWRDPDGYSLPQSRVFSDAATLPALFPRVRLTAGTLLEFCVPLGMWVLLRHTLGRFSHPHSGCGTAGRGLRWLRPGANPSGWC